MAIKSLSALTSKISSVLSPNLQASNLGNLFGNSSSSLTNGINQVINQLTNNSGSVNLTGLSTSLPKVADLISSLGKGSNLNNLNIGSLSKLTESLQPLLQAFSANSQVSNTQLLQNLPTIVNSMQGLINSFNGQNNVPEDISNAIHALQPLLATLAQASSSTDLSQIISTLNQVLIIAQPLIQVLGSISSSNIDLGDVAQGLTQALMPLLATIDTGNSAIDMAKLTQVLPTVVGSITTLVSTLTAADKGNIPETISGVIKGLNPLLKILAESGALDSDQAEIVNTIYDVLHSVKTILDVVNNPSLLTLSHDINSIIDSLKPIIALIDEQGKFSDLLDQVHFPEIGDLLNAGSLFDLNNLQDHNLPVLPISELLSPVQNVQHALTADSTFDLNTLLTDSLTQSLSTTLPSFNPALLDSHSSFVPNLDLNPLHYTI